MNFAEVRFWEILLATLGCLIALRALLFRRERRRSAYDRVALMTLGFTLLLAVSAKTFLIFLAVSFGTYGGLAAILRWSTERTRRRWLALLVPLQLLPLLYYKYAGFFANELLGLGFAGFRDVAIPVGLSFYSFQKVAFACDTLVFGKPLPDLLNFLNFAAFFPQIVAGPIERRDELLPQMEQFRFRWSAKDFDAGLSWIALGLYFKCCLGDNLAVFFNGNSTTNAWAIWAANVMFGLRIYYDFAGYSLTAVGLARCLGVRLTVNFASPYCSTSVGEVWRRWHITLSQWFRDYVYLPMGGSRVNFWWFNILVVFLLSGIWHGAGWNFLLWGAMHGLFLIIQRLWNSRVQPMGRIAWPVTMAAVFLSWLAFYETDASRLWVKLRTLFQPAAYSVGNLRSLVQQWSPAMQFSLLCFFLITGITLLLEWRSVLRGEEPYSALRRLPVVLLLVVLAILLTPHEESAFIYFAF